MDKKLFGINYFLKSDDAVAEVVDFVTTIGILMISFSVIALAGYPVLKSAQETRYIENTRLTFVILAENMNKIALGQAPSKSIELKMYGGQLSTTGDSTIEINATLFNSTSLAKYNITFSKDMRSIENTVGTTVVAYEDTGVWIKYTDTVVLNPYKPIIINQSGSIIIPVVTIIGNSSVSGTGMSRIRADGEPETTVWNNASNITVKINGDYAQGWKEYFENNNEMDWMIVANTATMLKAKLNSTQNLDVYIMQTNLYTDIV
jgi:citrate lyase alpha subunit